MQPPGCCLALRAGARDSRTQTLAMDDLREPEPPRTLRSLSTSSSGLWARVCLQGMAVASCVLLGGDRCGSTEKPRKDRVALLYSAFEQLERIDV